MSEFRRAERAVIEVIEGDRSFLSGLREVVTYQEKWNENLRRYWDTQRFRPSKMVSFTDVPGVPTEAFRHLRLVSSELKVNRVFRTSGTTSGARGEHFRFGTAAYDVGARKHFERCVGVNSMNGPGMHFMCDPLIAGDSSLGHMVSDLSAWLGCEPVVYLLGEHGAGWARLETLRRTCGSSPAFVFGTAFAMAEWFLGGGRCELPPGSLVVETGGFKAAKVSLSREEYVSGLVGALGSSASYFSEYSMTELSSQGYGRLSKDAATRFRFPEWCRVVACDPDTLLPIDNGKPGILRFVDLCNVESCVSVQTEDLGIVYSDGVELLGRLEDSTPRGCSLAAAELLADSE